MARGPLPSLLHGAPRFDDSPGCGASNCCSGRIRLPAHPPNFGTTYMKNNREFLPNPEVHSHPRDWKILLVCLPLMLLLSACTVDQNALLYPGTVPAEPTPTPLLETEAEPALISVEVTKPARGCRERTEPSCAGDWLYGRRISLHGICRSPHRPSRVF